MKPEESLSQNVSNELTKLKAELDKYKRENEKLKLELDKCNKENEKLKLEIDKGLKENEKVRADLFKANKIITSFQMNQINNNEIQSLRDENNKLKQELSNKENEIKDLQNKLQNIPKKHKNVDFDEIMVVNFISMDSTVHCGIKCLPSDIFAEVEEKLYQKYDNLRNTNNMFSANAKPVLRFKKICENNIKDGDILQLFKIE